MEKKIIWSENYALKNIEGQTKQNEKATYKKTKIFVTYSSDK